MAASDHPVGVVCRRADLDFYVLDHFRSRFRNVPGRVRNNPLSLRNIEEVVLSIEKVTREDIGITAIVFQAVISIHGTILCSIIISEIVMADVSYTMSVVGVALVCNPSGASLLPSVRGFISFWNRN